MTTWMASPNREPRWASNTTPGYADAACRADWKPMTIPSAHALRIPWNAESSATEARIGRQGGEVTTTGGDGVLRIRSNRRGSDRTDRRLGINDLRGTLYFVSESRDAT